MVTTGMVRMSTSGTDAPEHDHSSIGSLLPNSVNTENLRPTLCADVIILPLRVGDHNDAARGHDDEDRATIEHSLRVPCGL